MMNVMRGIPPNRYLEESSFAKRASCFFPAQCPFYQFDSSQLFNRTFWQLVADKREDAYSVLCDVFGLPHKIKEAIEVTTESSSLRFGNILHYIYHKDATITLDKITSEVSKKDFFLAKAIKEAAF